MGVIALKCSQAPNYPKPLGNILDLSSLRLSRDQCRTNGLWGSLIMDSQQQASDWLQDLYTAMNAAPVWSGFVLKSIPYSEVSAVGNGALYIAPTAPGPVANLTESDFIGDSGSPLISVERKAQVDIPNLLQLQTPNRASDYNTVVTSQPPAGAYAAGMFLRADGQFAIPPSVAGNFFIEVNGNTIASASNAGAAFEIEVNGTVVATYSNS